MPAFGAPCHAVQPGRASFGPNLAGIAGRHADRWLTAPQKTVPGTRMPFPGIPGKAQRQQIVAYLLTLE